MQSHGLSQNSWQTFLVFFPLLNLYIIFPLFYFHLSVFLLSLTELNWSDLLFLVLYSDFIHQQLTACLASICFLVKPNHGSINTTLQNSDWLCVTKRISLCCLTLDFDNLTPKLNGWFLIIHAALLICKHHMKATGEQIIIQGTSSQTEAVEPCDVRLINGMDWRAPAVGYVGQTN